MNLKAQFGIGSLLIFAIVVIVLAVLTPVISEHVGILQSNPAVDEGTKGLSGLLTTFMWIGAFILFVSIVAFITRGDG